MEKKKGRPLSEEILDLFDKAQGLNELRDKYTKLPFGHNKAVKCTIANRKARRKAWNMIYKLYPDLMDKEAYIDFDRQSITEGRK